MCVCVSTQVSRATFLNAGDVDVNIQFKISIYVTRQDPDHHKEMSWGLTVTATKLVYREAVQPESESEHGFEDEYQPFHPHLIAEPAGAADGAGMPAEGTQPASTAGGVSPSAGQPERTESPPPLAVSHAPVPAISTPASKDARSSTHADDHTPLREPAAAAAQPTPPTLAL